MKKIRSKKGTRTFKDLIDYITLHCSHGEVVLDDRLGSGRVRYAGPHAEDNDGSVLTREKILAIEASGVMCLNTAAGEMKAVRDENTRMFGQGEVHWMLSWRADESPTPEQMFEAGRHVLGALGLIGHQYVMAAHQDTENLHLHIAVNRVDPITFEPVDLYRDYEKAHRAAAEMEIAQGWEPENRMDPSAPRRTGHDRSHAGRLDDMRAWSDEVPFVDRVQRVANDLQVVLNGERSSWSAVHARLAEYGLRMSPKGSGLIVIDRTDPKRVAKASDIARFCSKKHLEAALGPFEPDMHVQRESERVAEVPEQRDLHLVEPEMLELRADEKDTDPLPSPVKDQDREELVSPPSLEDADDIQPEIEDPDDSLQGYGRYLWQRDLNYRRARTEELLANPALAIEALGATDAVFSSQDLQTYLAREMMGSDDVERLLESLEPLVADGTLVPLARNEDIPTGGSYDDVSPLWATKAECELEHAFFEHIAALDGRDAMRRYDASLLDGITFTSGQRAVMERVLSGEALIAIEGYAGSGKSFLFGQMAKLMPERRFLGLTQGGQQAADLQASTGIASRTIASFVRDYRAEKVQLDRMSTLLIDEANMIGTKELEAVLAIAVESGAKIHIAGDRSQLTGVAAGNPFGHLIERVGSTSLAKVVRLSGWRREAAEAARSSRSIDRAIDAYEAHGKLEMVPTADDAIERMVDLWEQAGGELKDRLLLASRNEEVDQLNLEARSRRLDNGSISDCITVKTTRHLELELGVGDRMIFRRNDARLNVQNGMMGTVIGTDDGRLRIRTDDEREMLLPSFYQDISYGYASTMYQAEGKTVEHAFWLATRADQQNSAYVALSRAKQDTRIVFAEKEFEFQKNRTTGSGAIDYVRNLKFLLARQREKSMATDFAVNPNLQPIAMETCEKKSYVKEEPISADGDALLRRKHDRTFGQWMAHEVGLDVRCVLEGTPEQRSWSAFHAVLEANHVCAERRGTGLVFRDSAHEKFRIKASSLPTEFRFDRLVERLGAYQSAEVIEDIDRHAARRMRDERLRAGHEREGERMTRMLPASLQRYHDEYRRQQAMLLEQKHIRKQVKERVAGALDAIEIAKHLVYDKLVEGGQSAARSITNAWVKAQRQQVRRMEIDAREHLRGSGDVTSTSSWRAYLVEQVRSGAHEFMEIAKAHFQGKLVPEISPPAVIQPEDSLPPIVEEEKVYEGCRIRPHTSEGMDTPLLRAYRGIDSDQLEHGIGYRQPGFLNKMQEKHYFIDQGNELLVKEFGRDAIRVMLLHAREKWGGQTIEVLAEPALRKQVENEAALMGIDVHGSQEIKPEVPISIDSLRHAKIERDQERDRGFER